MTPKSSALDLRRQCGQLLLMGFEGTEPSGELRSTFTSLQPGGIILFARNLAGAQQTHALLRESQKALATPAFLCVDLEGGTVDRFRDVLAPAPAVADVAATGNKTIFRKHGRLLGNEARALGFNTDFAPVLDLAFPPSQSVLTSRTVSPDPKKAVVYARECLKGLAESGVLGCGKHFPGLGEANLDTHKELPSIPKPWKKLWEQDLLPYRALRRDMPFVMVAHAAYPAVTRDRTPASLSKKWISDILRRKIGYRGLIISDDLEMGGVLATASIEDAAVETVRAGADIFLVCHNEEKVWRTYEAVLSAAERDRKFAALVADRAKRILDFKKKSPALKRAPTPPPSKTTVDRLRRAIWQFTEELRLASAAM